MSQQIPWSGYYHPKSGVTIRKPWLTDNGQQLSGKVGIFFSRSLLIKKDLNLVNSLIKKLEKRKIFPVAVFAQKKEYGGPGCPGLEPGLKLLKGVDLIINLESSFLIQKSVENEKTIIEEINVPIIQTIYSSSRTEKEWEENPQGISPTNQIYWVAQPEYNGVIEPILTSCRDEKSDDTFGRRKPVEERVEFLLDRICTWLKLYHLPASKRRITFLLHNAPCAGVEASIGGASGLDTMESVVRIMKQMKNREYKIHNCPENGKGLIDLILNKKAISEFRWTTIDEIVKKGGVIEFITVEKYNQWLNELTPTLKEKMISSWGKPPGEGMVYEGKIVVTGMNFGNINILVEPKRGCYGARCDGKVCKILHDPKVPPTHQCYATYKWAQENSDALISVGTHGYIEFLPGKSVGLSKECFPEIIVGDKPHLYIYTVKNPAEGILAKRRAYATLVDHMIPVMKPSGLYDELSEIEELSRQYSQAKLLNEKERCEVIMKDIYSLAGKTNLIDKNKELSDNSFIESLHNKLNLFRETQIRDGMHILSQVPDKEGIINMLVSILRFEGSHPSIRRLILELMGYNYEEIVQNPEKIVDGKSYGELLEESTQIAKKLLNIALKSMRDYKKKIYGIIKIKNKNKVKGLIELVIWAKDIILPKLKMTKREIPQILKGLEKKYIEPGASGLLTRGKIEVLPTGKNFYSIDPRTIPTRAAWKVGIKMANELLNRYLREEDKYPENIGMVLWSIDGYRADGEQISQILYLLGAKPVWTESGVVKGTEVIPLKELNRPRIDVTIRTSGIFCDTLPHLIELLDETIIKLTQLNESQEDNFIKKHVDEYKKMHKTQTGDGYDEKEAERQATYRLFCAQPGTYGGNGVSLMIDASAWQSMKDLGEIYIERGGYAYGKGVFGEKSHKEFAHQLGKVETTFHKLASDETDLLDCCCFYDFQGGMYSATKSLGGKAPKVYWGDMHDPQRPQIREMKEEIERVVRTRLLNPKWIEGMKRHGYKGASDISKRIVRIYGWDASAEVVADWIFDDIAQVFVLDKKMRKFFEDNNPWALEEIARRLLEAERRGIWKADPQVLKELQDNYFEIEGWMEEKMGDVTGEYQGGSVDILTKTEVEEWNKKGHFSIDNFRKSEVKTK
ncbi:MAG: cobaltochelatase subunit CobN [Elusimicrobiota bacterium]